MHNEEKAMPRQQLRTINLPSAAHLDQVPDVLTFVQTYRRYTLEYTDRTEIRRHETGLEREGWLWQTVAMAKDSLAKGASAKTKMIRDILCELARDTSYLSIANIPPARANRQSVLALLLRTDSLARESGQIRLGRGVAALRALIYKFANRTGLHESISRVDCRIKVTAKQISQNSRPVLGSYDSLIDFLPGEPIGATRFIDANERKRKILERAELNLEAIRTACIADIAAGAKARAVLIANTRGRTGLAPNPTILARIFDSKTQLRAIEDTGLNDSQLIEEFQAAIRKLELYKAGAKSYCVARSRELSRILFDSGKPFKSQRLLEMEYRATPEEVFASALLLNTYLGWNTSALLGIEKSRFRIERGSLVLQSYKSKTDDDTPEGIVDLNLPGVKEAVDLLLWNFGRIRQDGFADGDDDRMILYGKNRSIDRQKNRFEPVSRLKDFIERNSLQKFTLEQIRVQVLFIHSLREGGLSAARMLAGHSSIETTAKYLDQTLTKVMSSATNFEFSMRIESEVRYLFDAESKGPTQDQQIYLLRSIGDGSSCVDAKNVRAEWLSKDGAECAGQNCHSGTGCANRRIAIDSSKLEEVVRTHRHYRNNWQFLHQQNPERFAKHTLERMLFVDALYKTIKNGPHGWRLQVVEDSLA